jgi:hypothetical protein
MSRVEGFNTAISTDEHGHLWIAKFPSGHDEFDIGAWEGVAQQLAVSAKITISKSMIQRFNSRHHTFLAKRFDRVDGGRPAESGRDHSGYRNRCKSLAECREVRRNFFQRAGANGPCVSGRGCRLRTGDSGRLYPRCHTSPSADGAAKRVLERRRRPPRVRRYGSARKN